MSHYIKSTKVVLLTRPAYSLNSLYFSHAILFHVAIYCFPARMLRILEFREFSRHRAYLFALQVSIRARDLGIGR